MPCSVWWLPAETIAQSFPVLTLEQVYGAVTFYLAHKEEIDRYLKQQRADYEAKRQAARDTDPMFYQKMADARRQLLSWSWGVLASSSPRPVA